MSRIIYKIKNSTVAQGLIALIDSQIKFMTSSRMWGVATVVFWLAAHYKGVRSFDYFILFAFLTVACLIRIAEAIEKR